MHALQCQITLLDLFCFLCAVTQTLAVFTKMFNKAHDENEQLADAEKKKLEKEALKEQAAAAAANSPAWKESPARKEGIDALRAKINSRNQKQAS